MGTPLPEFGPQQRVWMAGAFRHQVWKHTLWAPTDIPKARADWLTLARVIAHYAALSIVLPDDDPVAAAGIEAALGPSHTYHPLQVDDIWVRDTGPIFVAQGEHTLGAVDCNFNGWGRAQPHDRDARLAERLADALEIPRLRTWLTTEGGALEFDGDGTLMTTRSSLLNPNRNARTQAQVETELRRVFGIEKILWLDGSHSTGDVTDGHVDFYARFARTGVVLCHVDEKLEPEVSQAHLDCLSRARDARGRPLQVIPVLAPRKTRRRSEMFCGSYLNFLLLDRAVIAPEFGDRVRDAAARATLEAVFPGRAVEMVSIDNLAVNGGGIHCCTLNQPDAPADLGPKG